MSNRQNYDLLKHAADSLLSCLEEDAKRADLEVFSHDFQARMFNLRRVIGGRKPLFCPKCEDLGEGCSLCKRLEDRAKDENESDSKTNDRGRPVVKGLP